MKTYNIFLAVLLVLFSWHGTVLAQQQPKVRAIFLLQFARYTSWPKDDNAQDFVMTVIGSEDVANELRQLTKGKAVQGRPIEVVESDEPRNLPKSDVIYLDAQYADMTKSVIGSQYGRRMLLVGGEGGMCDKGAQVSLIGEGDKVNFEWSKRNIEKAGIRINPKVLNMGQELN